MDENHYIAFLLLMTKCLIVAATATEIGPFMQSLEGKKEKPDILVTGVGMVATAFALGRKLNNKAYDFAINVGVCGSFSKNIPLGELVFIERDVFYELGAEDDQHFIPIDELGFGKAAFQAIRGFPKDLVSPFRQVRGLTVNSVHGNDRSIEQALERAQAEAESMEGAAFYYACEQVGLPCVQIRSISNYVEKRNRDGWQMGLAVKNLNDWLLSYFS
ncbi:futalosine hydrolase [Olivibacter sp. CPCC 100613]|uniref:futalosine hydrolase n=1 Tax=Olivibacter sp. CPCC 100613 TaxID=3079931 RepID=UPI002FFB786B